MDLRDAERALFTLDPDPGNVDIFWLDCLALNERFCACREQPTVRHITAEKKHFLAAEKLECQNRAGHPRN